MDQDIKKIKEEHKNDHKISEEKNDTKIAVQLAEAKAHAEEYLNNWKRERADFINYKNEEGKRLARLIDIKNRVIIEDFLEVRDDLERAIRSDGESEGLKLTLKKFDDMFRRYGVERIQIDGAFDPNIHEAVEMEEDGEKLEEIRPGYKIKDEVIRPAKVRIIK